MSSQAPGARSTSLASGFGNASCAGCHVDATRDTEAWDLGDPAGTLLRTDILDRGRDRSLVVILAADGEQRKQEKQIEYSVWSHISLLFTMFSSISRILHKIQILVHIAQRNREKVLGR